MLPNGFKFIGFAKIQKKLTEKEKISKKKDNDFSFQKGFIVS